MLPPQDSPRYRPKSAWRTFFGLCEHAEPHSDRLAKGLCANAHPMTGVSDASRRIKPSNHEGLRPHAAQLLAVLFSLAKNFTIFGNFITGT
jgi:hypothetical protein